MWGLLFFYPVFLISRLLLSTWGRKASIAKKSTHSPTWLKMSFVFNTTKAQRNPLFRSLHKMDMNLCTKTGQNVVSTGASDWKVPLKSWQGWKWTFIFILLKCLHLSPLVWKKPIQGHWMNLTRSFSSCMFDYTFNIELLHFWKQVLLWLPGLYF